MKPRLYASVLGLMLLLATSPAQAAFHLAVIDELMSGVGGDPSVQYVQVRMTFPLQNNVANTRLTAFNCDGSTATELLLLAANPDWEPFPVGVRTWIMATQDPIGGIVPDFTFAGGIPPTCGMVCWGAPCGLLPPLPGSWAINDPNQYIDCVAYGGYTGPTKTTASPPCIDGVSGTPTGLPPGDGTLALTRISITSDNATDFALACPQPTNFDGDVGSFGPCGTTTTTTVTTSTVTTSTTTTTIPGKPLTGKKLTLVVGAKPSLTAQSKDPTLDLGAGNGSSADPVANPSGGSLRVVATGGDGFDDTYTLPTGNWDYMGNAGENRGYKYQDKLLTSGPIRLVIVRPGKLAKMVGRGPGLGHTLATQPTSVRVTLTLGDRPYCLEFGGLPSFTANKRFSAKDAPAPGACP
jgi:hypothetical protein